MAAICRPNLKPSTQRRYLEVWGTHLLPSARRLRAARDHADARRGSTRRVRRPAGRRPTQRKALMILQGILRRAVVRGLIPANPVRVDKPRQPRRGGPHRSRRGRTNPRPALPARRDARLSLGVRGAATRARQPRRGWDDLRGPPCTSTRARPGGHGRQPAPPLATTSPSGDGVRAARPSEALIFPTHDGDEWKLHDWQNWRRRVYQPAAIRQGSPATCACTACGHRSSRFCCGRAARSRTSPSRRATRSRRWPSTTPVSSRARGRAPHTGRRGHQRGPQAN